MLYKVDNGGIEEKIMRLACSEVEIYQEIVCPYLVICKHMPIYGHTFSSYISTSEYASLIIFFSYTPIIDPVEHDRVVINTARCLLLLILKNRQFYSMFNVALLLKLLAPAGGFEF